MEELPEGREGFRRKVDEWNHTCDFADDLVFERFSFDAEIALNFQW